MGLELVVHCPHFRATLEDCERALAALPDGPPWSLMSELVAQGGKSRISRAEISQPLLTSLQIALVDILHASGVNFDAVVGHSSGEIGAAYAVGILTARDAIGIAYYRGLVVKELSLSSEHKRQGAMMAVGISFQDAETFCSQFQFAGRVTVAASNAPSSVTLSGDLEAIYEAKAIFDGDQVFTRLLKVDTAYHSHHMAPCEEAYTRYLEAMDIKPQAQRNGSFWLSSVQGHQGQCEHNFETLKARYWVENMVRTVMFSQALESTVAKCGAFAAAIEVGPHPALQNPVGQTLKALHDMTIPYQGCLLRGQSDIESLSSTLGMLWCHIVPCPVNFEGWSNAFHRRARRRVLKGLPSYSWDHDTTYWHESRISSELRLGNTHTHEVLGRLNQNSASEMTWRNIFRQGDIPWLRGHRFQGEVVFPGAGYVSMAVQAAQEFVRGRAVKTLELHDVNIAKALVVGEDGATVETIFTVRSRHNPLDVPRDSVLEAEFTCHSCTDSRKLDKNCEGRLLIHLGQSVAGEHLQWSPCDDELPPLDVERFHAVLASLGITYSGPFRALRSMNRICGVAQATASWEAGELDANYSLHPSVLDVAFQTAFATFSSIADKSMVTTFLPAGLRRVVIDPNQRFLGTADHKVVGIDAHLVDLSSTIADIDINVYDPGNSVASIQIDGLMLHAISEPQACDDRLIFAKTVWAPDVACGFPGPSPAPPSSRELRCIESAERTALFFLHNLEREIRPEEIPRLKWHHQALLRGIKVLLDPVRQGHHSLLKNEWLWDSWDDIRDITRDFPDSVEIALLKAVGEKMPSVLRGESELLEHMLQDDLLGRLYTEGRGFAACNEYVANFMHTISHKYPRLHVLEIGAGTGGTTSQVLDTIGDAHATYTYTDISAGFFEKAALKFADRNRKMTFKTLNIESSPADQGFTPASYDVVIAANVLHATRCLAQTVQHVRSLLRPGGFLVAVEVTGTMLRETGLMGGLEGWWLGIDEGRFPSPGISATAWDELLRKCGFSGIDTIAYDLSDVSRHNCSAFVTQAVDDRISLLRQPLAPASLCSVPEAQILILGGRTQAVSQAVSQIQQLLQAWTPHISSCASLEDVDLRRIGPETNLLSLSELDGAIFAATLSSARLEILQELLGNVSKVLWVTCGGLTNDPYQSMMAGIGRSLSYELPHVQMQFLDFDEPSSWDINTVSNYFLRLIFLALPQFKDPQYNHIWTQEPEIEVKGGIALVPRVMPDQDANERLNAGRRSVKRLVKPSERIIISYASSPPSLQADIRHGIPQNTVQMDVELSVRMHSCGENLRFLCFGRIQGPGTNGLALVDVNSSVAVVDPRRVVEIPSTSSSDRCDEKDLAAIGAYLIASHVVSHSPKHGKILVHQPTAIVAAAITKLLEGRGQTSRAVFIAATPKSARPGWTFVHPLAQPRTIRSLIPLNTTAIWRFSHVDVHNILSLLSKGCMSQLFEPDMISGDNEDIASALEMARSTNFDIVPSTTSIYELCFIEMEEDRLTNVIQWHRERPLSVIVPPTDGTNIFAPHRTYLLVGMTGELGQSLCRFMVSRGARHIVLASRNPQAGQKWIENLRKSGVDICIVRMDVTDPQQVQSTVTTIRQTMPKVAGVANAAFVLEDSLFVNATVESVERQLGAKVDGTIHLDKEFAQDNLDFFILFSSLGTVYGNPGQAVYHATNMFMTTFAARLQTRGQAASVINIGMISDVGYVAKSERANAHIEQHLRSRFYTPLSECEFHNMFVQAIQRGRPGSLNEQLTMGIEQFVDDPDARERPPWYSNPRFSHMVVPPAPRGGAAPQSSTSQSWRQRLEEANSEIEAADAFQNLFCRKLESMTQTPAASIDVASPLSDLGLDSLLAVEIRTWLLSQVGVEIPLLGILGVESILSITPKVAQRYAREGVAVLGAGSPREPSPSVAPIEESHPDANELYPEVWQSQIRVSGNQISSRDESLYYSKSNTGSVPTPSETTSPSERSVSTGMTTDAPTIRSQEESVLPSLRDLNCSSESQGPRVYTDTARASFAQIGLHFLDTYLETSTTFNVTAQYAIEGPLNVGRFSRALDKTLSQHDAYRTCFFTEPGTAELRQGLLPSVNGAVFTHLNSTDTDLVQDIFDELSECQWDLEKGRAFCAIIVTHTPESHSLLVGCHHIIMDGVSWHILLRDLDRAYRMTPLDNPPSSYLDYSREQVEALQDGSWDESTTYWLLQLDPIPGVLPLLPLARQRHRLPQRAYESHIVQRELSPSASEGIRLASRSCRATPMHFYLAVIQTVFANMLELTDMCIGIAHTGRAGKHQSDTIGHFTNLLPMRFQIDREASFAELLSATSGVVLNGLSHADVPFDHILERLGMRRSVSHTPLFQVAFNYRVADLLQRDLGNCSLTLARYSDAKVPYDVTFTVTQTSEGGQLLEVGCNASLYSQAATETLAGAYAHLLQSLATNLSPKLKNCLPRQSVPAEREWSPGFNTHTQDSWPETLTRRFQQVCASFPDSIAISDGDTSVTYHQLACRARQIAAALTCETGVKRGARVAVLCEPSVDMYAALLGVLHIGSVYFPLDPSLPMARIHAMMDACSPSRLLFHGATADRARQIGNNVPALDVSVLQETSSDHDIAEPSAEDEAFLLFTSGSTGVPKGIRLTQSGIMNYAAGKKAALALGPGLKVLQQSSAGFDMSIAQVVNAFANGGTLVVAPTHCRGDPVAIANLMAREQVNFTICTPSEYLLLATHAVDALQKCAAWRHACSGGEILTDGVINALKRLGLSDLTLTDCYGPSEVSCAVTLRSELVSRSIQEASVGRPIANIAVYILDDDGHALPAGYPGEICVGGRGVARGYLDEEHSATRFLPDPFVAADNITQTSGVMYKTGDKGCLRQDGSLVFLGRVLGDTMVKLRGFRVELDEVAVALLQAARGRLSDAVVGIRGVPQFLVAYVVKSQDSDLDQFELDKLCADLPLPRYMIPSVIMCVERLPTTLNGKVDRDALQDIALPEPSLESAEHEQPSLTIAEGELRLLWLDILGEAAGASRVVADTDFFMVGGSSLLLVRLQNALGEKMGVRIPLHELYQNSTLRSMAVAASEERGRVVADTVDWTGETSIPAHIIDEISQEAVSPAPRGTQRHVLLTGATGFLGSEILKALLADVSVSMVHCIAVPADKQHNISPDERVRIYNGSLASPTLGLSQLELSQLQPLIDQIIHAGSQGHCLNNYSTVRTANYISTQFLTSFALLRRVPLHFISSPRVILLSQSVEAPPASMAAHPPPTDGSQGFTASKWVSECFLEAVSRRAHDLPVVVHRPCSVVGALAPADDALNAVVRYSRLSYRVPDVPGAEGFFDFRDAAEVATEIVRGPVCASAPGLDMAGTTGRAGGLLSFRHYSSGVKVPFRQLGSRMGELYGGSFEMVPMAEWIDTAAGLGIESVIVSYLKANMAGTARLTFPYMGAS